MSSERVDVRQFYNEIFGAVDVVDFKTKPLFIAKQVATILGFRDPKKTIYHHVSKENKLTLGEVQKDIPSIKDLIPEDYKHIQTIFINEIGVNELVFESKMPLAKDFKHWIANDLLPTLRREERYKLKKQEGLSDIRDYCYTDDKNWRDNISKPENRKVAEIKSEDIRKKDEELRLYKNALEKNTKEIGRLYQENVSLKDELLEFQRVEIESQKEEIESQKEEIESQKEEKESIHEKLDKFLSFLPKDDDIDNKEK